jgi:hypothetical protein
MVRCADCGLLSARDGETGNVVEADARLRTVWNTIENRQRYYKKIPLCYLNLRNFNEELDNQPDQSVHEKKALQLIIKDIGDCPGFAQYQPGRSPQEHKEMIDQQALLRHQAEQAELARRHQDQRDERDRQERKEQRDRENKREDERDKRQQLWQEERDKRDREREEREAQRQAEKEQREREWQKRMAASENWWKVGLAVVALLNTIAILIAGWLLHKYAP